MTEKDKDFYNNEVFAQAEVVQHPKEENHSALILTQSFHLLSHDDLPDEVQKDSLH
ncbi:transcriptional regulator SplA domain-containing protein [Bacillus weihaiensis]|uniref:transcriptional regulator SplA domain-containing protein n=1 Tax=Bacillus weihaiensis TaxID=1547283 RepID=UPI0011AB734B|nr:transcriptional regulator SplA domain-containing protein [Bacillus weihaiensis]